MRAGINQSGTHRLRDTTCNMFRLRLHRSTAREHPETRTRVPCLPLTRAPGLAGWTRLASGLLSHGHRRCRPCPIDDGVRRDLAPRSRRRISPRPKVYAASVHHPNPHYNARAASSAHSNSCGGGPEPPCPIHHHQPHPTMRQVMYAKRLMSRPSHRSPPSLRSTKFGKSMDYEPQWLTRRRYEDFSTVGA